MTRLESKIAIVTGASKGIGRAIALAFAREGAKVALTARNPDALGAAVDQLRSMGCDALAINSDVSIEDDAARIVQETLQRFGRLDILVNNAAIIHKSSDLVDFDLALWRHVIEVNLIGAVLVTKAALPSMIANGSGKVINIASIGGRHGARGRSAYRASKAGLINLTESIAAEVHQHGIAVNCICPGSVATEGAREAFGTDRKSDPRMMAPNEIAEVAVFLASDSSSAITGTAIDAFGGTNPIFS